MLSETMTSRERAAAAMRSAPVDRACVGTPNTTVTIDLQERLGVFFPEAHLQPAAMVRLAEASHTVLGYDTIMPVFSSYTSASALGVNVEWNDRGNMPGTRDVLWKDPDEIVVPADFLEKAATSTVLEALAILRERHPHVAIIGKCYGPWSLAFHTFGVQDFLLMLALDPGKAKAILDKLKEVPILFGKAQIALGIDALKLVDHCSADLVSPRTYRDFLMPVHAEIHERLGGAVPMVLHTCGKTLKILPHIATTGLEGFNIDTVVDAVDARRAVGGKVALWGGVNNPSSILGGDYEAVKRDVYAALDAGYEIIGPECTVPLNCRYQTLARVVDAVRDYHREGRIPGRLADACIPPC
jgi:MtaA/CmuA family methyltransferase